MNNSAFSAFVSSTSGHLETHRAAVANLLWLFGARKVRLQRRYPNGLAQGKDIEEAISSSDIIVCLVGHRFGGERENGESWTQWELRRAISSVQEKPTRGDGGRRHVLIYFYEGANGEAAEDASLAQSQQGFRNKMKDALKQQDRIFYHRYGSPPPASAGTTDVPEINQLLDSLADAFGEEEGLLHDYSAGLWARVTGAYRERYGKCWREELSQRDCVDSETQTEEFLLDKEPPLIADQRFEILMPQAGRQENALHPQAFVAGLTSEEKAQAQNKGDWRAIEFGSIVSALGAAPAAELVATERVAGQTGLRLFFVSAGGVGKSVALKRLREEIHASQQTLAIHMKVAAFATVSAFASRPDRTRQVLAQMAEILVDAVADSLTVPPPENAGASEESVPVFSPQPVAAVFSKFPRTKMLAIELIEKRLELEAKTGRVALLVDELDHVDNAYAWLPLELQRTFWNGFHVVLAGRPHALVGWGEGVADRKVTVEMKLWRFIEPQEFTDAQSSAYLGGFPSKVLRHPLVKDELGELVNVPRILMYVRTLKEDEIKNVRSPAEIYSKALVHIIDKALEERTEAQRKLSCLPEETNAQHVLCVLSALAFQTLFEDSRSLRPKAPLFDLRGEARLVLWWRLERRYQPYAYLDKAFENDMRVLGDIATIVGNGILDDAGVSDTLKGVIWANRTVQQYLAAYWLARHACAGRGGKSEAPAKCPELARPDAEWLRCAIFYPHATNTDMTEDLNRFLAEMPKEVVRSMSWAESALAWYDPNARDNENALWSTEMIYRSWTMMHDIASDHVDDWWDISYQSLFQTDLAHRWEKSRHLTRTPPRVEVNGREAARAALALFKGHFAKLLNETSEAGDAVRELAEYDPRPEMAAAPNRLTSGWIEVPPGRLDMGTIDDDEHQGFPSKTKAHWNRVVDRLIKKEASPIELATEETPLKWFSGAQGKRSRVEDIAWLANDIFEPHLAAIEAGKGAKEASRDWILTEIAKYFRRRDEIPRENPQNVRRFVMHEMPVLNRWFFAFALGHKKVVREILTNNAGGDFSKLPSRKPGHPAIYIAWFDAWAFAQWASWTDAQGNRFVCRLPHEVEWEYACRFEKDGDGNVHQVVKGQRYWWGNEFYEHPHSPEAEYPAAMRPWAHVFAKPGDTRPPEEAKPNGLGFKDMLGNVWEWSANPYDFPKEREMRKEDQSHYSRHLPASGQRPRVAPQRALRGGIWYYLDMLATCSSRFRIAPNDPDYKLGFRLVREVFMHQQPVDEPD